MSREAVFLRVDAGPESGWDAWYRCQVLAYGVQRRRRPCYFLSQLEPNGLALSLKSSGHEWIAAEHRAGSPGDLDQLLFEVRKLPAAAVIVDAPDITPEYLAELASAGVLVACVDTQAAFRFPAHLIFNPTLNRQVQDYEVCGDGQVLCGTRYVLVRPEVKRIRPQRCLEPPPPWRVAVALGDDVAGLTLAVVKTLLRLKELARVEVLTWPHHPAFASLEKLVEQEPERLALATKPASWGLAMMRSQLAVATSGPWALELAYVGVPAILITDRPEMQQTAELLSEEGIARHLGPAEQFSATELRDTLLDLLDNVEERQNMSRLGRAFLDGRGIDRFVQAIELLLHAATRRKLSARAA